MVCPNCGKYNAEGAKFCAGCGNILLEEPPKTGNGNNRNPQNGGKIAGIIIAIVLVLAVIGAALWFFVFRKTDPQDNDPGKNVGQTVEDAAYNSESSGGKISKIYKAIGKMEDISFTVSSDSAKYMDEYPEYFPCSKSNATSIKAASSVIGFNEIKMSCGNYNRTVLQIEELTIANIEKVDSSEKYTFIYMYDKNGNPYTAYYLGDVTGIKKDDKITAFGLPLDIVSLKSNNTEAIALALCHYAKSEKETTDPEITTLKYSDYEKKLINDPIGTLSEQPDDYYRVNTDKSPLIIRERWSKESRDITQIPKGEIVYVYGFYNDWAYVEYKGAFGWVFAEYLVSTNYLYY